MNLRMDRDDTSCNDCISRDWREKCNHFHPIEGNVLNEYTKILRRKCGFLIIFMFNDPYMNV